MPCRIPSHTHDWPRSGTLSISKCESKCGFCTSTKDYKPASALRKHVLTHIKNDKMSLTLEKSIGGRPRLQTTPLDSIIRDQPEPPPSGSELPVAANPVLGNSDAGGEAIKTQNDVLLSLEELLILEKNLKYLCRLDLVPAAVEVARAAFFFSKICGLKEKMAQEGLDCLRICLMECCEDDKRHTALACNHDSHWDPAPSHSHERYHVFRKALEDTAGRMAQPLKPATLLDVFYATTILSIIRRVLYISRSTRGKFGTTATSRYYYTTTFALTYQPIINALGKSDKTYRELCDDVYRLGLSLDLEDPYSDFIYAAGQLLIYNIYSIAQELDTFLYRVEPL
ncbi:hypothetical protein HO173_011845 [Letharia columbiana]|uniref:Uncharacterized protein n=1 Tax=Letharia columbiana TaxID=112416 RepID=A0A8H6FHW4_9LECA|nr:uncharacterized protein HO173_011845 [Letharia columbiana]KAF6228543.1 hypothetical protein HO173_011845 [Letharia columbiana]